ncbi:carboxypeptidase regulatory-like domain-containing protein [Telmatocola sphagniphila]|uniref:Carboxypeptidase regulatory-like domain-containing protein n=1 Tax=Telmatocola sphagniphila TaxID=1123043 RepID=A0A8E6B4D4_9BACT|nr:Ig-like domain-containing protein [Telmatocola sphagniphila]QVL30906.1 carboxypeptidase regulatory-like domain-containing protein [Telmatocola sphagniphila]
MRIFFNLRSINAFLLLSMSLFASSGCGGGEKVVAVSGTVTHNGQPVPGLVISFVPEGKSELGVSSGQTDEQGKYSLKVVSTGRSGAVVGKHKVWVSMPREQPKFDDKEERNKNKKKGSNAPKPPVPPPDLAPIIKLYGSLEKSKLTVDVSDGSAIDLKLD